MSTRLPLLVALCLVVVGCDESYEVRAVATTGPVLDASLAESFWDLPWPNDSRRLENGNIALQGFPNPGESTIFDRYIAFGEEVMTGFGTNSPVYLRFDGSVRLPEWTEESVEASGRCEGPVRILDVAPTSPAYGTCLPARWEFVPANTAEPFLAPNLAVVAPYWGFPLRGGGTYAVYLVDLESSDGFVTGSSELQALLAGTGDAALQSAYQPFVDYLATDALAAGAAGEEPILAEGDDEPVEGLDVRWIAHATVFTTEDPTGEMRVLSEHLQNDAVDVRWEGDIVTLDEDHPEFHDDFEVREGTYFAPNFQRGEIPYNDDGGGFEFDAQGEPIAQLDELIPFALAMPRGDFEQPADGWPVILHAHGTGGDRWSHITRSGNLSPGSLGANRGFLSVGIPQPFHGDRWPEDATGTISLLSFNFANPESGRTTFRQGALDTLALKRFLLENFAEGGAVAAAHPELKINPNKIFFLGHSQGGTTGALIIPFTDGVEGWVLSGAGGGFSIVVLERQDPVDFLLLVTAALQNPPGLQLTRMHPAVGLIQTLIEVTDPVNYGPLWIEGSSRATSVLLTEGMHDIQTPPDTAETLAVSAGLPLADPFRERNVFGLDLQGLRPTDTPYAGNLENAAGDAVTGGLAQFDSNHFAIFNEGQAAQLWANFLKSFIDEGAPGELGYEP
ncbi:MAG: hypothetical protein KDA24_13775 [Deltaproteobacteria bacterium]|nr:hypothetical protein [Deltaproteobacteria bacterium]